MAKLFEAASMAREILFLTKPIATYNNTLIDAAELRRRMALYHMQTINKSDLNNTDADCGMLACLPVEIYQKVLEYADISSVMYLRATNSTLKQLVELWPPFVTAMQDARPTVVTMVATGSAKLWTFVDFASLIYTSACHMCGQHGEILHLLKLHRVCFKCVTSDRRLLAVYEPYVLQDMGLSNKEIETLPQLSMIPQKSFWRTPSKRQQIYDYSAALDLAMKKHAGWRPTQKIPEPRSMHRMTMTRTRICQDPKTKFCVCSKVRKPVYMRRKSYSKSAPSRISNLPTFLINPPESSYAQHACCTYFPALTPPGRDGVPTKVPALLCAGCSFYFNYHTHLPHQTHTLYAYNPVDITAKSPLIDHLQSCFYARLFWENLYQPHMNYHDQTNPHLRSNGGTKTLLQMATAVEARCAVLLNDKEFRFRHFPRHPLTDDTGTAGVPQTINNAEFEMIPHRFLTVGARMRKTPKKTGLAMELERKAQEGDPWVVDMMNTERDDERFDPQTRDQIDRLRLKDKIPQDGNTVEELHEDQYADVFLGGLESVSQASWATMRPGSANCLTRGWTNLLVERAEKEIRAEAEANGQRTPTRRVNVDGGNGWGWDRLGCVSFLG